MVGGGVCGHAEFAGGGDRLSSEIEEFPSRAHAIARQGFAITSRLSEADLQAAVAFVIEQFRQGGGRFDVDDLPDDMNLSRRDRSRLTAALSMIIGLFTESGASADEFVEASRDKLFDPTHERCAETIGAIIVGRRQGLNESIERRQLAISVLPYLTQFEVTVDLRVRVDNERVADGVALAVVHIDTDGNNQELWMQLTRLNVENIRNKLTNALNKMTVAERLLEQNKEIGK